MIQQTLEQGPSEIEKTIKKVEDDNRMVLKLCNAHQQYYWRDKKLHKGQCGICKLGGDKMTKIKEAVHIDDGTYPAQITGAEERTEPFNYTDILVVPDKFPGVSLKYGCPTSISIDDKGNPITKLAKFLVKFGFELKIDEDITIDDILEKVNGKKVEIVIENKTTDKGTFARIISMKPTAEKEEPKEEEKKE